MSVMSWGEGDYVAAYRFQQMFQRPAFSCAHENVKSITRIPGAPNLNLEMFSEVRVQALAEFGL